jgi:hypothetical protein
MFARILSCIEMLSFQCQCRFNPGMFARSGRNIPILLESLIQTLSVLIPAGQIERVNAECWNRKQSCLGARIVSIIQTLSIGMILSFIETLSVLMKERYHSSP